MDQSGRREILLRALLKERPGEEKTPVPRDPEEQKRLLRAYMNVRPPMAASGEFLAVQDEYLREAIREKGMTRLSDLTAADGDLYLWQGDITTLACDAIVNAANRALLGCFRPLHNCIDNCIHTYAGVQLRLECARIMEEQGHAEPTGTAKITPAYNLPSRYVLHTVGPIVGGYLTRVHKEELASCYRSCLDLAAENGCESVAFCCISTGVFGFPKREAAQIAVKTVRDWKAERRSPVKVVFNVFGDEDLAIYREILCPY